MQIETLESDCKGALFKAFNEQKTGNTPTRFFSLTHSLACPTPICSIPYLPLVLFRGVGAPWAAHSELLNTEPEPSKLTIIIIIIIISYSYDEIFHFYFKINVKKYI